MLFRESIPILILGFDNALMDSLDNPSTFKSPGTTPEAPETVKRRDILMSSILDGGWFGVCV